MGLFVTVAGPDVGSNLPSTGSPALFVSAGAAYQLGFMGPESGLSSPALATATHQVGFRDARRLISC
ncbi:hypothetical protein ABTY98_33910 [Streptomyces sp. NPDC096040]|uniref:hypothetical protein n=1 Tax=Streptomyces sp. NPDC096040 TaxID=3155541 RepID=UPI00332FF178